MQFCRMLKSIEFSHEKCSLGGPKWSQNGAYVVLKRQDGIMIVYETRHDAKLRTEKSVLSKTGVKREQRGCKEGAKREQKGVWGVACWGPVGGGEGLCFARPCLRRILKDLGGIWIKFLESV